MSQNNRKRQSRRDRLRDAEGQPVGITKVEFEVIGPETIRALYWSDDRLIESTECAPREIDPIVQFASLRLSMACWFRRRQERRHS